MSTLPARQGAASRRQFLLDAALLVAVSGCAAPYQPRVDAAFFPSRTAPDAPRWPGRVAVVVPATRADQVKVEWRMTNLKVPVAAIVEAAVVGAFDAAFEGGAVRLDAAPGKDHVYDATVVLTKVLGALTMRMSFFLPLPYIGGAAYDHLLQVGFELQLADAAGKTLLTRTYDTGAPAPVSLHGSPDIAHAMTRAAHEWAWRLASRAARECGDWLQAERAKLRML